MEVAEVEVLAWMCDVKVGHSFFDGWKPVGEVYLASSLYGTFTGILKYFFPTDELSTMIFDVRWEGAESGRLMVGGENGVLLKIVILRRERVYGKGTFSVDFFKSVISSILILEELSFDE